MYVPPLFAFCKSNTSKTQVFSFPPPNFIFSKFNEVLFASSLCAETLGSEGGLFRRTATATQASTAFQKILVDVYKCISGLHGHECGERAASVFIAILSLFFV